MKGQIKTARSLTGFTFIELVIVSSVLSIVMIAIYSSFLSGLRLWQRSKDLSITERKIILGLEKFSAQVRQSVDFEPPTFVELPPQVKGFNGNKYRFSFSGFERYDEKIGEERIKWQELSRITFEFDPAAKTLYRKSESYKDIFKSKEIEPVVFISGIDEASFTYYAFEEGKLKPKGDDEEWKDEDGVPAAIEINIKFKEEVKSATIFIPVA